MEQGSLEGLYEKLRQFDRLADKEEYLFDAIRDAVEAENFEFAAQICDFVLNDEFEKFGAVLRTRALMWHGLHRAKFERKQIPEFWRL